MWSAVFYEGILHKMVLEVPVLTHYVEVAVTNYNGELLRTDVYTKSGAVDYGNAKHIKMDLTRTKGE